MRDIEMMTKKELIAYAKEMGLEYFSSQSKTFIVGHLKWSLSFIEMNNPTGYQEMINKVSQG